MVVDEGSIQACVLSFLISIKMWLTLKPGLPIPESEPG